MKQKPYLENVVKIQKPGYFYHTKTKRKTDNWPSTTQESHNVSYFLLCKTKMGLAAAQRGLSLGLLLSFNILPTGTVSKDLFLHNLNIHPSEF